MTAPTLSSPLRLEVTSAGMRGVLMSLMAVGFVFGIGGLAAGIGVLFEKQTPLLFFFMLPLPFMVVGGAIFVTAIVFFFRRITLAADPAGITRTSRFLFFRRERHFSRPPLVDVVYSFASGSSDALCLGKIHMAFEDGTRVLLLQRYGMTDTRRLAEALRQAVYTTVEASPHEKPPGGALSVLADDGVLHVHLGTEPASRIGANSLTVSTLLLVLSSLFCAGFIALWWQMDPSVSGRALATVACGGIWVMFVVICSTIIVQTRRRAREEADIQLDAATLRVQITGSPAARHYQWERSAVRSMAVEPSGMLINDQPVFELHLYVRGTTAPVKLFTGRDIRDLRWIAETFSQRLALPDSVAARHQILQHLDSTQAAAVLSKIDYKLRFGNWVRLPSQDAIVLQLPPAFLRGLVPYIFAVMWLAIVAGMIVLSLLPSSKTPPAALLFLALFATPALGLAYIARRMTKATLRVEITAAALTFRSTIVRTREFTLSCDKIEGVGTTVAGSDDYGLYVDMKEGRQWISLNFSNADLDSLAELLAIALALTSPRS